MSMDLPRKLKVFNCKRHCKLCGIISYALHRIVPEYGTLLVSPLDEKVIYGHCGSFLSKFV